MLQATIILSGIACVLTNYWILRQFASSDDGRHEIKSLYENDDQHAFELTVPFYMYDSPALDWVNATLDGKPYAPAGLDDKAFNAKHDDDFFMLLAARKHPLRTLDPSKAKLFYVPVMMNAILDRGSGYQLERGEFCVNGQCFQKGRSRRHLLIKMVDDALGKSPYFQRSDGKDHVVTLSHFSARGLSEDMLNIHKCNSIIFEKEITKGAKQFPDRIRIPGMYIGNPCEPVQKTHDFAMIASIRDDDDIPAYRKKLFKPRGKVCRWLAEIDCLVSTCGSGSQCPALGVARYGFHVRGDTWGSNRLMDTIMSRTVPIFTNEVQYEIVPSFYPWKSVSYLVNISTPEAFQISIKSILERPANEFDEKLEAIEDNMYLLNHTKPYMFDRFMAEFARELKFQ